VSITQTFTDAALSSYAAIVLGSRTVRSALINFAKSVTFSTAPSLLSVVAMRAGINLLARGATESVRVLTIEH
jgi:8-amino-7-oxononanoate synthase